MKDIKWRLMKTVGCLLLICKHMKVVAVKQRHPVAVGAAVRQETSLLLDTTRSYCLQTWFFINEIAAVGQSAHTLRLPRLPWNNRLKVSRPTDEPKMNPGGGARGGKTFLFTSESVGEGHSGVYSCFHVNPRTRALYVDMFGHAYEQWHNEAFRDEARMSGKLTCP